jgi:recombinational DNA repair protein RecR
MSELTAEHRELERLYYEEHNKNKQLQKEVDELKEVINHCFMCFALDGVPTIKFMESVKELLKTK